MDSVLENLTVWQLAKKLPAFYVSRIFIALGPILNPTNSVHTFTLYPSHIHFKTTT
jgi:hypothetical protein